MFLFFDDEKYIIHWLEVRISYLFVIYSEFICQSSKVHLRRQLYGYFF
jgi:hypothetical protein